MEFRRSVSCAIGFLFCAALLLASPCAAAPPAQIKAYDRPEYLAIQKRIAQGWGTWNARNVLSETLLPECLSVHVAFKQFNWLGDDFLGEALIGRKGQNVEEVRPGWHALDGSYSDLELRWKQVRVRVQAASDGNDFVMLITPLPETDPNAGKGNAPEKSKNPVSVVLGAGMLWNRPGELARVKDVLIAKLATRTVRLYATEDSIEDPYVQTATPYLVLPLNGAVGISSGRHRSIAEIETFVEQRRKAMEERTAGYGDLRETYLAVESGIAWNLIYEPKHDRLLPTVGRLWDEEYGGYAQFGWDNFFLAYMSSLYSRDLAYAAFIEHLRSMTGEGFIPNDDRGNGTKSWDHSQPPVGAIMLKEIYKRYPERWLLEASFDDLLTWNRWWIKARMNDGLLSYGSDLSKNPMGQTDIHTKVTAGYESGMDDSPMYENVPFNSAKNTLELQDIGLNSLYVADCKALAEIARRIGRHSEAQELDARAEEFSKKIDAQLWDEKAGSYLNRRTDTGAFSDRMSPTIFYPLLAGIPDASRAKQILAAHFFNPEEFYGEYMLPSIARDDPAYPKQGYWKGAVWPPLNFLVYLGLRDYGAKDEQRLLAEKSRDMFLAEWRCKGYVSENYSAITGTGDDPRLSSDEFHSWGALMGFLSFIEAGKMPPPEASLDWRAN